MSYKTISDRNYQLVNHKKLLYINNIKLPEDVIGVIKKFVFINYYEAAVIKFAESRKKRICTVFYNTTIIQDSLYDYCSKIYHPSKDYIDSFWFEINICFKCGEYLMISYNKNTQSHCSTPLCNCNTDINTNPDFYYDSIYE